MPAFPIRQDPDKIFLVDKAPVYTGMLCEIFRRQSDVRRSIHLSSSVCAVGPNADYLVRDYHFTDMPWGKNSPFLRLTELDARIQAADRRYQAAAREASAILSPTYALTRKYPI